MEAGEFLFQLLIVRRRYAIMPQEVTEKESVSLVRGTIGPNSGRGPETLGRMLASGDCNSLGNEIEVRAARSRVISRSVKRASFTAPDLVKNTPS